MTWVNIFDGADPVEVKCYNILAIGRGNGDPPSLTLTRMILAVIEMHGSPEDAYYW